MNSSAGINTSFMPSELVSEPGAAAGGTGGLPTSGFPVSAAAPTFSGIDATKGMSRTRTGVRPPASMLTSSPNVRNPSFFTSTPCFPSRVENTAGPPPPGQETVTFSSSTKTSASVGRYSKTSTPFAVLTRRAPAAHRTINSSRKLAAPTAGHNQRGRDPSASAPGSCVSTGGTTGFAFGFRSMIGSRRYRRRSSRRTGPSGCRCPAAGRGSLRVGKTTARGRRPNSSVSGP